ncbi:MAG: glycosyltransferase [Mariprofundaceae bacterium]
MRVAFLNPQGNFDQEDSHLTEHPDFGGQLIYVKEVCMAMSRMGVRVDIITRRIDDPDWPEFSDPIAYYEEYEDNLRIVRIDCGGPEFLNKERLWPHLDEFTDNILSFYGDALPDFATGHYGDGGYCGVLLKNKAGIGFTFTGHSLGAQKLDKLGMNHENFDEIDTHYHFSKRITAERLSMEHASTIITSTAQERFEQYSHPLYEGAVDVHDDDKFSVIPPGVNTRVFTADTSLEEEAVHKAVAEQLPDARPAIVMASRFEEKKNHIGVLRAYALTKALQDKADLVIFIRGIEDPYAGIEGLPEDTIRVLEPMLALIEHAGLRDKVHFINVESQRALAATYRYFARNASVFVLASFYEPFGLAPIEAAACGLAVVATKNGGPTDIFEDGSGILIDPADEASIAEGLLKGLNEQEKYAKLSQKRVREKYTWDKTAEAYLNVIRQDAKRSYEQGFVLPDLEAPERIKSYLGG